MARSSGCSTFSRSPTRGPTRSTARSRSTSSWPRTRWRAGMTTPAWAPIEGTALRDLGAGAALGPAIERVGLPCVVKPSRSGSALGVTVVERETDLPSAVMSALSFSGAAVVETAKAGIEVAVGVIGTPGEALPAVEIVPKGGTFDYAARYTAGATEYFAPARLAEEAAGACRDAAMAAWSALRLRDVTRVDMIVDAEGVPWVLEVNVSPGMTETSLLPMGGQRRRHGVQRAVRCRPTLRFGESGSAGRLTDQSGARPGPDPTISDTMRSRSSTEPNSMITFPRFFPYWI